MKNKFIFFFLPALALLAASCERPPLPVDPGTDPGTEPVVELLSVSVEGDGETKSTVHPFTGKVSFTEGDQIVVWYKNTSGTGGTWSEPATIKSDQKVAVSKPSSHSADASRAMFAVFPAGAQSDFNLTSAVSGAGEYYKITFGGTLTGGYYEYDLVNKAKNYAQTPMIAVNDPTKAGLRFYHMGGLLRFKVYAIPAGTKWIEITSTDGDPIAGEFPILFNDNIFTGALSTGTAALSRTNFAATEAALYNSQYASGIKNVVRVKISESGLAQETDGLIVNLPVPIGTYNTFRIDALNASGASLTTGSNRYYAVGDDPADKDNIAWDCERTLGRHINKAVCFIPDHPINNPNYVPGKFSVSPTEQVWFSSGNLYVDPNASPRVWKFEDEQYGISGYFPADAWLYPYDLKEDIGENGYTDVGRGISHFGWATAGIKNPAGPNAENRNYGYDVNHVYYEPNSISGHSEDRGQFSNNWYGYGPSVNGTTWAGAIPFGTGVENSWNYASAWNVVRPYCDWGVHFDDAGNGYDDVTQIGPDGGSWYTLSAYEWSYLLFKRDNWNLLKGTATIFDPVMGRYVYGLVICPDNWETPASCKFLPTIGEYTNNVYTAGDTDLRDGFWKDMEEAGAVFLPAAGYRYRENIGPSTWYFSGIGNAGYYWSSSADNADSQYVGSHAYCVKIFNSNYMIPDDSYYRYCGCSVRLVHSDNAGSATYPFSLGFQPIGGGEDNL